MIQHEETGRDAQRHCHVPHDILFGQSLIWCYTQYTVPVGALNQMIRECPQLTEDNDHFGVVS